MRLKVEGIAKKYAQALLNIHFENMNQRCFNSLVALEDFFSNNKEVSICLSIPTISNDMKEYILEKIFEKLNICNTIKILVNPLLQHRRIEMFRDIIRHIIIMIRELNDIITLHVITSHKLAEEEQKKIIVKLRKMSKTKIFVLFNVDSKLVAGIKIYCNNMLWESSVSSRLKKIERAILQQVTLW
jgi:F-type H+-transporting ATPase subunit delta